MLPSIRKTQSLSEEKVKSKTTIIHSQLKEILDIDIISNQQPSNKNQHISFTCNKHPYEGIQSRRIKYLLSGMELVCCKKDRIENEIIESHRKIFEDKNLALSRTEVIKEKRHFYFTCNIHKSRGEQWVRKDHLDRNATYCKGCLKEYLSEIYKGENSPNWKGGITSLSENARNLSCVIEWKKNVLIENNFKCSLTGNTKKLEVHHLYSFNLMILDALNELSLPILNDIGDYDTKKMIALESLIRLKHQSGSGVVLTKTIHKLFHTLYGYGNNTPEQFNEFKSRYNNGEFNSFLFNEEGELYER